MRNTGLSEDSEFHIYHHTWRQSIFFHEIKRYYFLLHLFSVKEFFDFTVVDYRIADDFILKITCHEFGFSFNTFRSGKGFQDKWDWAEILLNKLSVCIFLIILVLRQ